MIISQHQWCLLDQTLLQSQFSLCVQLMNGASQCYIVCQSQTNSNIPVKVGFTTVCVTVTSSTSSVSDFIPQSRKRRKLLFAGASRPNQTSVWLWVFQQAVHRCLLQIFWDAEQEKNCYGFLLEHWWRFLFPFQEMLFTRSTVCVCCWFKHHFYILPHIPFFFGKPSNWALFAFLGELSCS